MTDAIKLSDLKNPDLQNDGSRRSETLRRSGGPRQTRAVRTQPSASSPHETQSSVVPDSVSSIAAPDLQPGELDLLYRSLAEVTPENHPRTARLLASSTRKTAQKVIEEAGEVALEAVKHHDRGIVRESADLLYHLVALWHRAGGCVDRDALPRRRTRHCRKAAQSPPRQSLSPNPKRQATGQNSAGINHDHYE
jgi:phosphoribosyl-ATP pyrophosphohydrolase